MKHLRTLDAETMLRIHQALHSPVPVFVFDGELYSIEYVRDEENLYKRLVLGDSMFLTQNVRKDSPNTKWVCESPHTRHISWWLEAKRDHSFRGKVVTHLDNPGACHVQVLQLFRNGRPAHVLMNRDIPLMR